MAQKIQTLFIDDLDGSEAEGTIPLGLDDTECEIDLNVGHAWAMRDAPARYVHAARRAGDDARRPARGGRRASAGGVGSTEVRQWAKVQGIDGKTADGCLPGWWPGSGPLSEPRGQNRT